MFRHIGSLISLTILLALVRAEPLSLNCENLNAATCKQRFKEQMNQKIKIEHVHSYKESLILAKNFYTKILEDLPENSQFIEPVQNHLNAIDAAVPKLKEDITAETMIEIMKSLKGSEDPVISIDDRSRLIYDDILSKNNIRGLQAARLNIKNKMYEKLFDAWKELFAQLRPVDLAAYSEYEKFSTDLKNATPNYFGVVWEEIGMFLDMA